jgi:hypothetical protein
MCEGIGQLSDEIAWLRLRDKKIMYLISLLNAKGYPVHQVYESQIKNIPTLRFDQYLAQLEEEKDNRCEYSFFPSEDSYEPLTEGPMLLPVKPAGVPDLDISQLPEYQTSSEEGEESNKQLPESTYQESMNYINQYYAKNNLQ